MFRRVGFFYALDQLRITNAGSKNAEGAAEGPIMPGNSQRKGRPWRLAESDAQVQWSARAFRFIGSRDMLVRPSLATALQRSQRIWLAASREYTDALDAHITALKSASAVSQRVVL